MQDCLSEAARQVFSAWIFKWSEESLCHSPSSVMCSAHFSLRSSRDDGPPAGVFYPQCPLISNKACLASDVCFKASAQELQASYRHAYVVSESL